MPLRLQSHPATPPCRPVVLAAVIAAGALTSSCASTSVAYRAQAARVDSLVGVARQNEQRIDVATLDPRAVGVLPLTVVSTDTLYRSLGHGLAALIAADLSRSPQLTVVERLRIDAVLRELQLADRQRIDPGTAPRAGKLIGATRLVTGTIEITPGRTARVASQVANVVSGKVGGVIDGDATLTQLLDAEKRLVFRLFEELGVSLTPAERRRVERKQTTSLSALLAFSAGVRAEQARDFAAAANSFRQAVRLDPGFAEAETRGNTIAGAPLAVGGASGLERVVAISNDLVNRPVPVSIGSPADAPVVSRQQLVNITITIRTP